MDKEYEILADRLIKALKGQNEEQLTLKLISGEVVSSDTGYTKAMIKISSGVEIQAINKSKEQLKAGESVWIGYIKSLADAVVLFKAGASAVRGVGEDLGNGNERFADYENNTAAGGYYNSIFGYNNHLNHSPYANAVFGRDNTVEHGATGNIVGGDANTVWGSYSIVIGNNNSLDDSINYSFVGGYGNQAGGTRNTINGYRNTVSGTDNIVSGSENTVSGPGNVVSGTGCSAAGSHSIVSGRECVVGTNSFAIGEENVAHFDAIAIGIDCAAFNGSVAAGRYCFAGFDYYDEDQYFGLTAAEKLAIMQSHQQASARSYAFGYGLKSSKGAFACGEYNDDKSGLYFAVGGGSSNNDRKNIFEVDTHGNVNAAGTITSNGQDYAEYFKWLDGNSEGEDRAGIFVTLDGEKIRPATIDDDYILGITTRTAAIIGTTEGINMENGDTVGMLGQLVVRDDGSCKVNGYCEPGRNGIATATYSMAGYRVIKRLDESHIKIIFR